MILAGYEWGYECPECETYHQLSGMMGENAIINGEKEYRTREISEGDTLICSECDYSYTL